MPKFKVFLFSDFKYFLEDLSGLRESEQNVFATKVTGRCDVNLSIYLSSTSQFQTS